MQNFALRDVGLRWYVLIINVLCELDFGVWIAVMLCCRIEFVTVEDLICLVGSDQGPSLNLQSPSATHGFVTVRKT